MANAIRFLSMDAVEAAQSGHPGMPMGMADVATVLFRDFLNFDPHQPAWPNRDRFVLSAGHGSMLLYSLLYLTGYPDMTLEELKHFRQLGSRTAGHPEYGHASGIETTTGPLGQGITNAVGIALGQSLLAARFGEDLFNHFTYVIASDGDLMEGISHEAISFAGHLKLGKLIVFFDDNHISIDGPTSLAVSDNQTARFEAAGWHTTSIDGHDEAAIIKAIQAAQKSDKPSLIACRTQIAFGAPKKVGTAAAHGAPLGADEIAATRAALGWSHPPFVVPEPILKAWRDVQKRGVGCAKAWDTQLESSPHKAEISRRLEGHLPKGWEKNVQDLIAHLQEEKPRQATRQLSQRVLEVLTDDVPEMVGGSADLTGSNNTKAEAQTVVTSQDFSGSYIHYGVREHGMAAIMNGLSLSNLLIPYGGTFLIFSDYMRPALRLSALMKRQVIYVLTHDSIGLGEDGPTHQPIEQLAALRAIPNLNVFRPADGIEVAECWALALEHRHTPSILALTRQSLPTVRLNKTSENLCARGGYLLKDCNGARNVTLIGTGSEIEIALNAQDQLRLEGIEAAVVSMPCWRLFDDQPEAYRNEVLGNNTLRVAIEAAGPLGWEKYVGSDGIIIGMTSFGASAPAKDLYRHFGITAEAVVKAVVAKMKGS
ncbi:MAG: transketolase [Alphaproteobacteria bacterium]|nr:transketolase [Alphaproteobacteria bacterium]